MSGKTIPSRHSFQDITGNGYGALVVESYDGRGKGRDAMSYWLCRCLCGSLVRKRGQWLRQAVFPWCAAKCPLRRHSLFLGGVSVSEGCWLWTGGKDPKGYGRTLRFHLAHRVSWELFVGPIPKGLCVLHECDNPPCVRPDHLFLGTNLDNVKDMVAKGRQARGEANGRAKLTDAAVILARAKYGAGGLVFEELAAELNVSESCVRMACRGDRWSHLAGQDGAGRGRYPPKG